LFLQQLPSRGWRGKRKRPHKIARPFYSAEN
jgi:hypothetical protein